MGGQKYSKSGHDSSFQTSSGYRTRRRRHHARFLSPPPARACPAMRSGNPPLSFLGSVHRWDPLRNPSRGRRRSPRRLGFSPPCAPVSALPLSVAPVLVRPGVPAPSPGGSSTHIYSEVCICVFIGTMLAACWFCLSCVVSCYSYVVLYFQDKATMVADEVR